MAPPDAVRYVTTPAIKAAVNGREGDILDRLGIAWRNGRQHISCPYPDHDDHNPSWRWDEKRNRAYCTCITERGSDGIFDVIAKVAKLDFAAAKLRAAELLGRSDLIKVKGDGAGQKTDAASLLSPPAEGRDDSLVSLYLATRLGLDDLGAVPLPTTKAVGWRLLGYYDPPDKTGGRPKLVASPPCAVFETVAVDGRRHAHRIYLNAEGTGKAELGPLPNGKARDPKKSARRGEDQPSTAGCCVVWGKVETAPHEIVAEGIENAATIAYAFADEIATGEIAVLSAITAGGIEALTAWPAARTVTIAADRDEAKQGAGFKRGEKAARRFAARMDRQQHISQLALPGQPGNNTDFLDLLLAHGIADVRAAVLAAEPIEPTPQEIAEGVQLEDFYAYMEQHNYIYAPTRAPWPRGSVNARLPLVPLFNPDGTPVLDEKGNQVEILPSSWLDKHRPVEQITWAPGRPTVIRDRLISEGGWIERRNVSVFNLYRPPLLPHGDPDKAGRWIAHVDKVYQEDAEHIRCWLAHRVQSPQDKINHALVLGGLQGIGKDSLIEPVKRAVGPWNVAEPSPTQLTGRFNGFVKSVILRISEAHDLGDIDRYQFYEHLKVYCAAPPDVLRVDEKNLREYNTLNCCGVIITTNHKTDGIYLPADDRRHYVAWSNLTKENFTQDYWGDLWRWYDSGGDRHVAAYLAQLDLSGFNPKAPPPKTKAFWDIVDASRAPEDTELAEVLEHLKNPPAVTLISVANAADSILNNDFAYWLRDRRNRRVIPHRFEACGYVPVRNPDRDTGLWVIDGRRQVVYAKDALSLGDQTSAAAKLR